MNEQQAGRLEDALDAGPAACGWAEDQRWTLARVTVLIDRLFQVSYTLRGTSYLLHRLGWSPQVPPAPGGRTGRGGHRHLDQGDLAERGKTARDQEAWICFEDEAGQSLRPPKARTWSRRGCTPVITVTGKGSGRVSIAGLLCLRPGHRTRLIYRMRRYRGRRGEKGFREADHARLLDAAHQQLGGPIVLIWDNLMTHRDAPMRRLIDSRPWPAVFYLPSYAPELNPAEGVCSHLKRSLGNLAPATLDQLAALIRTRLRRMQRRSSLQDAFFTHAGLVIARACDEPWPFKFCRGCLKSCPSRGWSAGWDGVRC
ncbi:IS630 family transposase [Spongiactinospora sp. 9N601]|uniref:IS630 family transposase n=1 Tax=Spongiactinospora sp. 9N601 TaxID=3375149 RepID=UPI003797E3EB